MIGEIVRKVSSAIKKPVTVKIRKGFSEDNINTIEVAKIAEENGAAAVAVHARTREQYYSGKADWSIIRAVKEVVSIPVIGSGDVFSPEDAKQMIEQTNCDAIMLARGTEGIPGCLHRLRHILRKGSYSEAGISRSKRDDTSTCSTFCGLQGPLYWNPRDA